MAAIQVAAACGRGAPPADAERRRRAIDPPAAAGALGPSLAVRGDTVWASWIEPARGGVGPPWRLRASRLGTAPRRAWGPATTIAEGQDLVANWADFPSLVETARGRLVAHWLARSDDAPEAYGVELGSSDDGGRRWRRLGPAHDDDTATEHGFVSLLPEGDAVRAVWLDGREMARQPPGATTLRTAVVGTAVTRAERLDERVCDCCATDAATTSRGPVVVYRDRDAEEVRDVAIVRQIDGRWTAPAAVHRDGWRIAGCPVNGPAVAARGVRVVVAWFTGAEDRSAVKVAFSNDAGATFDPPIEIDAPTGRHAPLGRVDVALAPSGEAIVAWLASEREDGVLLVRRVRAGGATGEPVTIARATVGRVSGFPRLVSPGGADLLVAWTDARRAPARLRAVLFPLADLPSAVPRARTAREAPPPTRGPAVGEPAPPIEARTLGGARTSLGALRGEVVLLHVWATWCEPCRRELPELAALHERHRTRGLRVVGISVDRELGHAEIASFVERRGIPYDVWLDPEDAASRALGVDTLPASFLIDRTGRIAWRRAGAIRADDPTLAAALGSTLPRE
jgi:peroxiredoxin